MISAEQKDISPAVITALSADMDREPELLANRWRQMKAATPLLCKFLELQFRRILSNDEATVQQALGIVVETQLMQDKLGFASEMRKLAPDLPQGIGGLSIQDQVVLLQTHGQAGESSEAQAA